MSTKQAINDKLQGSVATYLRCGGVVNNQIKNGFCWICEWSEWRWARASIGAFDEARLFDLAAVIDNPVRMRLMQLWLFSRGKQVPVRRVISARRRRCEVLQRRSLQRRRRSRRISSNAIATTQRRRLYIGVLSSRTSYAHFQQLTGWLLGRSACMQCRNAVYCYRRSVISARTAKRWRKCTRQPRSCLYLCQIFTDLKKFSLTDSAKTVLNLVINNPTTP